VNKGNPSLETSYVGYWIVIIEAVLAMAQSGLVARLENIILALSGVK
jgi:hypothetical protein